jgi:hypothetical protein
LIFFSARSPNEWWKKMRPKQKASRFQSRILTIWMQIANCVWLEANIKPKAHTHQNVGQVGSGPNAFTWIFVGFPLNINFKTSCVASMKVAQNSFRRWTILSCESTKNWWSNKKKTKTKTQQFSLNKLMNYLLVHGLWLSLSFSTKFSKSLAINFCFFFQASRSKS